MVEAIHVSQAVNEKLKRLTLWQEKLQELILDDTIMIDIDGEKIGEVNGLAVYNSGGDYSFGKPVKITAKSFMGEKGLVNIPIFFMWRRVISWKEKVGRRKRL